MLPLGLPADAEERVRRCVLWLRESCARVCRWQEPPMALRITYESGRLTLSITVAARLSNDPGDPAHVYRHAQECWSSWLRDNPDLAVLPEPPAEGEVANTRALSNSDFATRMRAMRERQDRGKDAPTESTEGSTIVLWDDTEGGACF